MKQLAGLVIGALAFAAACWFYGASNIFLIIWYAVICLVVLSFVTVFINIITGRR